MFSKGVPLCFRSERGEGGEPTQYNPRFSGRHVRILPFLVRANLEAAHGRIMDVDIAEESMEMAKYNILTQASAAMLAQANTTSDVALMLLR